MSRFTESKRLTYIANTEQRMAQASQQLAGFSQAVLDVYANWVGYLQLEQDVDAVAESRAEFAVKARELVDSQKAAFAVALDIIAAGMRDAEGNPLTRSDLLAEIQLVPAG